MPDYLVNIILRALLFIEVSALVLLLYHSGFMQSGMNLILLVSLLGLSTFALFFNISVINFLSSVFILFAFGFLLFMISGFDLQVLNQTLFNLSPLFAGMLTLYFIGVFTQIFEKFSFLSLLILIQLTTIIVHLYSTGLLYSNAQILFIICLIGMTYFSTLLSKGLIKTVSAIFTVFAAVYVFLEFFNVVV